MKSNKEQKITFLYLQKLRHPEHSAGSPDVSTAPLLRSSLEALGMTLPWLIEKLRF